MTAAATEAQSKQGRVSGAPGVPAWREGPATLPRWRANVTPPQEAQREGHTAVRTDEDSSFDTLWLLKKMDSQSETPKTGRSLELSSMQRQQFQHLTPGGSTTPATGRGALGLRVQQQPPGPPPTRRDRTPWDYTPSQGSCFNFSSHITTNGLIGPPPLPPHLTISYLVSPIPRPLPQSVRRIL